MKNIKIVAGVLMVCAFALFAACGDSDEDAPAPAAPAPAPAAAAPAAPAPAPAAPAAAAPAAAPEVMAVCTDLNSKAEDALSPCAVPAELNEAPMLASRVASGDLPPVAERLPDPEDSLIYVTAQGEEGKYGGTLRRVLIGPTDVSCNRARVDAGRPYQFANQGLEVMPHTFKDFDVNEDGTEYTVYLRKGGKWSDGAPYNADNLVWSVEHFWTNPDVTPNPKFWVIGAEKNPPYVSATKIDDYTVKLTYPSSYYDYPLAMARGCMTRFGEWMLPSHYLEQFHKDFNPEADQLAKDAGFEDWIAYINNQVDERYNAERPTARPWKAVSVQGDVPYIIERNPYYMAIDQFGNQLPYIDRIRFDTVEGAAMVSLKAIQGEIDFQARHLSLSDFPVLKENEEKGNYTMMPMPAWGDVDNPIYINSGYQGPEKEFLNNLDFRIALAIAIDREFMNDTIFLGMGTIRNAMPALDHPWHPGEKYETLHTEYDPDRSREILDGLMGAKDSEGFYTFPNGDKFEMKINTTDAFGGQLFIDTAESGCRFWSEVGIRCTHEVQEKSIHMSKAMANEYMATVWACCSLTALFAGSHLNINHWSGNSEPDWATKYSEWLVTNGESGVEPPQEFKDLSDKMRAGAAAPPGPEKDKIAREIFQWHAENQWVIGMIGQTPVTMGLFVVNNDLGNVPDSWVNILTSTIPNQAFPVQWYFKSEERRAK